MKALLDLEVNSDLKASLRELHITAAKEVAELCQPLADAGHSFNAAFRNMAACSRDPQ